MKYGLNKVLFDKRNELQLSRSQAAHKLGITRLELLLIEEGYITVRKKIKNSFIISYELNRDFFLDDYRYPVEIEEEPKPQGKFVNKFLELYSSIVFKIVCAVFALMFAGMAVAGSIMNNHATTRTTAYFSDEVLKVRDTVIKKGHVGISLYDSEFVLLMFDKYYSYENNNVPDKTSTVSINFFSLEENTPFAFFKSSTPYSYDGVNYTLHFESRINYDCFRTKLTIYHNLLERVSYINADINYKTESINYLEVYGVNAEGNIESINKKNPNYSLYTGIFESNAEKYTNEVVRLFKDDPLLKDITTAEKFTNDFASGVVEYDKVQTAGSILTIIGTILSIICIALACASIFQRTKVYKKYEEDIEEISFENDSEESLKDKEILPRNQRFFPILPEYLIKLCSITVLMIGSIGIYFVYKSIYQFKIQQAIDILNFQAIFQNFTIIGIMMMFFIKLDIYQNKKNMFLINYSLFFVGLAYYIMLLLVKGRLLSSEASIAQLGIGLLDLLPGNAIWGILAFNLFVMFLFYEPSHIKDNKKRMIKYRTCTAIPLLYLITSFVLTLGRESFGWKIPFEIYSLFFSKSGVIVVFALLFVFAVYFYKKHIYKIYTKEEADCFVRGNHYYFTKNLIASLIIFILGLTSLIFYLAWPNNPYGLDKFYWILCCIPFMLLYHPHMGRRNGLGDLILNTCYALSLCIGILLILGSSLSFFYYL